MLYATIISKLRMVSSSTIIWLSWEGTLRTDDNYYYLLLQKTKIVGNNGNEGFVNLLRQWIKMSSMFASRVGWISKESAHKKCSINEYAPLSYYNIIHFNIILLYTSIFE